MTRTRVRFRGITDELPTESEAYVWLLNRFLRAVGNFFESKSEVVKSVCEGRRGAVMFASFANGMHQPKQLANGWYAETCLNEEQKDRNLCLLAQLIGVSPERDYEWHAMNGPKRTHLDVTTLKRRLKEFQATKERQEKRMGICQEFRCDACGLTAQVAGGPSMIMAGYTETRFCPTCRKLVDVMTAWGEPPGRADGLNECGECHSTQLTPWQGGQPCPVCGGKMATTSWKALTD